MKFGENAETTAVIYADDYLECRNVLSRMNVRVVREFPFIGAFGVSIPRGLERDVAAARHARHVVGQASVFAQMHIARDVLNADAYHGRGIFGRGVAVAVIDTGIYPHLDFMLPSKRLLAFADFTGGNGAQPYDDNGHGTFVAGVALGNGLKSNGRYRGVAPLAGLVSLRALDRRGEGGAFGILEAMQWLYDNAETYGVRVACMSFGSAPADGRDPLLDGAEALWRRGITVIAAAGNNGPRRATVKSPGTSSLILTVGGMDDGRAGGEPGADAYKVADFSSRGPVGNLIKPDIIAPAVDIVGPSNDDDDYYSRMSGTSVAAPMAAGMACLLLEERPELTPDEIKNLLKSGAVSVSGDPNAEGAGLCRL